MPILARTALTPTTSLNKCRTDQHIQTHFHCAMFGWDCGYDFNCPSKTLLKARHLPNHARFTQVSLRNYPGANGRFCHWMLINIRLVLVSRLDIVRGGHAAATSGSRASQVESTPVRSRAWNAEMWGGRASDHAIPVRGAPAICVGDETTCLPGVLGLRGRPPTLAGHGAPTGLPTETLVSPDGAWTKGRACHPQAYAWWWHQPPNANR